MYRLGKCANKGAKCGSCNSAEDLYDLVLCETESCKTSVCICKDCMLNLAKQCNEEVPTHDNDDIEEGIEFPTGTFTVGPFTCKCTAKYKDKVEVTIINAGSFRDYGILSILAKQYGQGILISNYTGECRVVIPIENIIERGGLL